MHIFVIMSRSTLHTHRKCINVKLYNTVYNIQFSQKILQQMYSKIHNSFTLQILHLLLLQIRGTAATEHSDSLRTTQAEIPSLGCCAVVPSPYSLAGRLSLCLPSLCTLCRLAAAVMNSPVNSKRARRIDTESPSRIAAPVCSRIQWTTRTRTHPPFNSRTHAHTYARMHAHTFKRTGFQRAG